MARKEEKTYVTAFNEYRPLKVIGQGGSGVVYEALDVEGRHFAVKVIDPTRTSVQKLKRFQNEIYFLQKTSHKNIIKVLDYGRGPGKEPFYVMPLYETTLEKAIRNGIPPAEVLRIFSEVLDGVEAAHLMRVTHRDLKPQNILCDEKLESIVAADFGIASFEEEDLYTAVITKDNERLANFQYAAPEQRARGAEVTSKADVYALGVILNEMFTKQVLQGTGFRVIGAVDPNFAYLDEVVEQMVRQDPTERPEIGAIKRQLIARRVQFINQQKIDRLSREVVPESTIDDPLVRDPIRITAVDYKNGTLIFSLSQVPDFGWIQEFTNQTGVTFFHGYEPSRVGFFANTAQLRPPLGNETTQTEHFKSWIKNANNLYKQRVEREALAEQRRKQQQLEAELAAERERKRVLGSITI